MIVNVEFLGEEPLDNVITCLDYQVDRVLYFGYGEQIARQKNTLTNFLEKDCHVQDVQFYKLPEEDLDAVIAIMRREIETQVSEENELYFDITGGESLALIAFGVLSRDYDTPMHGYDIANHKFHEYECGSTRKISERVPRQNVKLNIKQHIRLRGGVVNERLHKDLKDIATSEFDEDVTAIWNVEKKYVNVWNCFSDFMKRCLHPEEGLYASETVQRVRTQLAETGSKLTEQMLHSILSDLKRAGVLTEFACVRGWYHIAFKNQNIKECIWDAGSVLELHTYQMLRKEGDDCEIGIHLDWDGVIHEGRNEDVQNEIDVLLLKDNVLTFVSCKGGNIDKTALYELDTVTKRFGGKYAKMRLVTMQPVHAVNRMRAEEMGIEVWKM